MAKYGKSVLIVEDQFLISEYLRILIEEFGLKVCGIAKTADQAVAMAKNERPDIVLMDMRLEGDRDGVDAAKEIIETVDARFIYVTGSSEPSAIRRINEDSPFRILIKPIDPAELHSAIIAAAA
jgi:DNA-binding NarL/FixJ family response regulator